MTATMTAWFVVAVVLAAFVGTFSGFGFGIGLMPVLSQILGAGQALGISLVLSVALSGFLALRGRDVIDRRLAASLARTSAVGTIVGGMVAGHLDDRALTRLVGFATLLCSLALLCNRWGPAARNAGGIRSAAVGGTSGFLMASASMGGPPVMLYLSYLGLRSDQIRATAQCVFFFGAGASLVVIWQNGTLTGGSVVLALAAVPGLAVGIFLGENLARRIDEAVFRYVVLVGIAGLGLYTLAF